MRYEDIHEVSYENEWRQKAIKIYRSPDRMYPQDNPNFDIERIYRLMQGSIDTHIHPAPDAYVPRLRDEIDLGIEACEEGMGAIVFKSTYDTTARSVCIAQKVVDKWAKEHNKKSTRLIGGIVLDRGVGGLNPVAVRCAARLGGKFVWTPTFDSSHQCNIIGEPNGIEVIGEDDKVVPELREIFKIIVKYDLVLALCHHTTRERFIMIDDAKEEGVKRIIIVHATESLTKMSIDQMKIAAEKGAYIELSCIDFRDSEVIWEEWLQIIKEVGADNIILSTDCGYAKLPPPAQQFKCLIFRLLRDGVPDEDLEKMIRINAEKLIF
jgi:hypothetical protein